MCVLQFSLSILSLWPAPHPINFQKILLISPFIELWAISFQRTVSFYVQLLIRTMSQQYPFPYIYTIIPLSLVCLCVRKLFQNLVHLLLYNIVP